MTPQVGSRCTAAEIVAVRAEARRDLKAMLLPFAGVATLIAVVTYSRGGGALWPVWATIATTMVVGLVVAAWGTYIRGWRVMRAQQRHTPAGRPTAACAGAQAEQA
jgi:hypothetical protein